MKNNLIQYVCGFAFDSTVETVYLLRKKRPIWQEGKLNGIGGKVELQETPLKAMVRKFYEECGVVTTLADWTLVELTETNGHYGKAVVYYYAAKLSIASKLPTTQIGDAKVESYSAKGLSLSEWQTLNVLQNLPYLINKSVCTLEYKNEKGDY